MSQREKHKMRRGYKGAAPVMYCRTCRADGAALTKHCVGRMLTDAEESVIRLGFATFHDESWLAIGTIKRNR